MADSREYGGIAGVTAINQDLEETCTVLARVRGALDRAEESAARISVVLGREASLMDRSLQHDIYRADSALQRLRGTTGIEGVRREVGDLKVKLQQAAEWYANADSAAMLAMTWEDAGRVATGVIKAGWWLARWGFLLTPVPTGISMHVVPQEPLGTADIFNGPVVHAGIGSLCTTQVPGHVPLPSVYETAAASLKLVGHSLGTMLGRVPVAAWLPSPGSQHLPAPTSLGSLMGGISQAYDYPQGAVVVQTFRDDQGEQSAVVSIPGTTTIVPNAPTTFGAEQNLSLVLGEMSLSMEHTVAAIDAAGLAPGTPLLLQGHSQGGMVAMALAEQEWFREKYALTHVITVGSPAGHFEHSDGVNYLHAINRGDVVPALGCDVPPDRVNVVTNVFTMNAASLDLDLGVNPTTLMGSHDFGNYTSYMDYLDQNAGPSTQQWIDSADAFLGGHQPESTLLVVPSYVPRTSVEDAVKRAENLGVPRTRPVQEYSSVEPSR